METPENRDLPKEVIKEILLRLPVKTLQRFKSVCREWYTLIGSPHFIDQHFSHESNHENLLVLHQDLEDEDQFAFALFADEALTRYEEPDYLQIPVQFEALMGPVNGVFCVFSPSKKSALLNPGMRQFKPLPDLVHSNYNKPNLELDENLLECGFGLDPLSGDYKLVLIQSFFNKEKGHHDPCLVSVYNSGNDSWKHFEDVDLIDSSSFICKSLCNTYLNGVYYWLMVLNGTKRVAILAFDMGIEQFQEIQAPPDGIEHLDLTLYGDSLALISRDRIRHLLDVWVMKDEGCWSKIFTIGPFEFNHSPIGFWKDNGLLLQESENLILYNVYTQESRTLEVEYGFFTHNVFSYKESLVSIKGEGDDKCILWDTSADVILDFFSTDQQETDSQETNSLEEDLQESDALEEDLEETDAVEDSYRKRMRVRK